MPRPLRLDHAGAWFHVTARGNERQAIYLDDADRLKFLSLLARARSRFDLVCHAYCLMGNHYHLVVESVAGRLSRGMQFVNGSFGRYFNERRGRVGHLFQGRFKASLIERNTYLLEAVSPDNSRNLRREKPLRGKKLLRADFQPHKRPSREESYHDRVSAVS